MRLSEQTVSLLKNFASINQNLQFKTGNKLRTISPQKNILVNAEIPESFPSDFAIYDLNKFLGVLSLFQDPTLEIGEHRMNVGGKVNYVFADPAHILVPPDDKVLEFPEPEVSFALTNADFTQVIKAASLLGLPHICVVGNGTEITLEATDVNNSASDDYKTEVGTTNETFNLVFKIENLKLYTGDYNVELTSKGISKFSHTSKTLQYFIATESDSSFGE
ncbi:MAG: hypothetical protein EX285_06705 [Thaumarchaeota archaeon]|nr:hypothetical protein [Nitrososphaerota archaeon]